MPAPSINNLVKLHTGLLGPGRTWGRGPDGQAPSPCSHPQQGPWSLVPRPGVLIRPRSPRCSRFRAPSRRGRGTDPEVGLGTGTGAEGGGLAPLGPRRTGEVWRGQGAQLRPRLKGANACGLGRAGRGGVPGTARAGAAPLHKGPLPGRVSSTPGHQGPGGDLQRPGDPISRAG